MSKLRFVACFDIMMVVLIKIQEFIYNLAGELARRLAAQNVRGTNLTFKLMRRKQNAPLEPPKHMGHGPCDTFNKTTILGVASNSPKLLGKEAQMLMRAMNCPCAEMRGLGLMMTKLSSVREEGVPASQKKLPFLIKRDTSVKVESLDQVVEQEEKEQNIQVPARQFPPFITQFVVPTQIDESVLKSLPQDIQQKITLEQERKKARASVIITNPEPETQFDSKPKKSSVYSNTGIPSQSQLDPEVLASLPPDIKAEILAEYASSKGGQTLLPQSPRKNRVIPSNNTRKTAFNSPSKNSPSKNSPSKRRTHGGLFPGAGQGPITSFQTKMAKGMAESAGAPDSSPLPGLDKGVLAELPEDIRKEVIAQARQEKQRLQTRFEAAKQKTQKVKNVLPQRRLQLPAKPKVPLIQGVSKISDVRNLMTKWFNNCRDEGPHYDDVGDLVVWLKKVVMGERNVEKAVMLVQWFEWVVKEGGGNEEWWDVVEIMREGVKSAGAERGLFNLKV